MLQSKKTIYQPTVASSNLKNGATARDLWSHYSTSRARVVARARYGAPSFDWLFNRQVEPANPAHTVRWPRYVVTSGQTSVLDPAEARELLDSIDVSTHAGLLPVQVVATNTRNAPVAHSDHVFPSFLHG